MSNSEEECIYEVEKILDSKTEEGKTLYLVKWLGWDAETDNTWEPAENFSKELLEEYEATAAKKSKTLTSKKGHNSKTKSKRDSNIKTTSARYPKRPKLEDEFEEPSDEEDEVITPESMLPKSVLSLDSWEELVSNVHTICHSPDDPEKLEVVLRWKDDSLSSHTTAKCNQKCPQKVIKFYESHLIFKNID